MLTSLDPVVETGGYSWPAPGRVAERWRYETVKACQEALKEPVSEYDPRARLKMGFIESRASLLEKLKSAVADVAEVD
jgi:hypothetical protein